MNVEYAVHGQWVLVARKNELPALRLVIFGAILASLRGSLDRTINVARNQSTTGIKSNTARSCDNDRRAVKVFAELQLWAVKLSANQPSRACSVRTVNPLLAATLTERAWYTRL